MACGCYFLSHRTARRVADCIDDEIAVLFPQADMTNPAIVLRIERIGQTKHSGEPSHQLPFR
jgi:hypothetical protein